MLLNGRFYAMQPNSFNQARIADTHARAPARPNALARFILAVVCCAMAATTADAAVNPTVPPDVSYVVGSTRKIEQLIGNTDFQRLTPTGNRTQTRYGITGSDLGVPFTHKGVTYVVFGDTLGGVFGDCDPLSFTTDTDPEDGLLLNFLSDGPNIWRPITIPGISQGAFEVPLDGVSVSNRMYLYHSTDHSASVTMGRSVMAVPPTTVGTSSCSTRSRPATLLT